MLRIISYVAFLLSICTVTVAFASPPPVINAAPSTMEGCEGLYVSFNNTTVATSHYWNFGTGNGTSILQSPGVVFINPGTHVVTYTATNASGQSTKTWNIVVHPKPIVNFTASPASGCEDLQVQFTDATIPGGTGANTYEWVYGGQGSGAQNPNHTFTTCGSYDVTLKVTNQYGCAATVTKPNMVTVHCNPIVSFVATPSAHCMQAGQTTYTSNFSSTITGGVQPYIYAWNFSNGSVPPLTTMANPPAVPFTSSVPKTYNVSLKVTDANGCVGEMNKPDYIRIDKLTPDFTISPAQACMFTPVTVTNTSASTAPGIYTTSWNWGDGPGNTTGSPATHTYTSPGTKNIKLTATIGACQDTISKKVIIHPQPDVNFSFTPEKPCPAPQTINFTATGANTYAWNFGTGPGGSGSNPAYTYTSNGFYTVQVIGTDNNGCKDTVKYLDTVKLYDAYTHIYVDTPGGCVGDTVRFSCKIWTKVPMYPDSGAYPYNIVSYLWEFGDGETSHDAAPYHVFTKIQKSRVILTVLTENGCIFKDTTEVIHDTLPDPGFYITPTHICNRKFVYAYDTSKKYPTDTSSTLINNWQWYLIPAGGLPAQTLQSNLQNPAFFIEYPDVYHVVFYAGKYYCRDSVRVDSMIFVNLPRADFQYKVSCDTPLRVHFTNKSYGYHGISNPSYKWYFGDPANTTSTDLNPSFTYPALGNYTAMIVAFNDTLNCSDTFRQTIVLQEPELNITASDTTICPDDFINMYANVTKGNVKYYYWYVNNVLSSSSFVTPVLFKQFKTAGLYDIKLVTQDVNNCLDSVVKEDYIVVSKPNVDFTNQVIGCKDYLAVFTDNSTRFPNTPLAALASRYWNFGNGTATTTNTTISNAYTALGSYDVKLVVTDINGCKDSIVKPQQVKVFKPKAFFDASDIKACAGEDVAFYNKSDSGVSAYWEFGDGNTSNDYSPLHSYAQPGIYSVLMVVTDKHGCKDTLLKPTYITVTKPVAAFTMDDSFAICHPHKVQFDSKSAPNRNALKHAWDFGLGPTPITLPNPLYAYNQPGYFTVSLIVTDPQGCKDTAYGHVDILGYSGAIQYSPLFGCKPLDVNFTANVNNVPSMIWDFNDGYTVKTTATQVSHTYVTPGAYIPKIIFSDSTGCSSTSEGKDTIKVDGIIPGFTHTPACEGYTVQFEDTSKGLFGLVNKWEWTFDNGQASAVKKAYHYYGPVGTYPVKLIVTNTNGCKDSLATDITIHPLPVIDAGADTIICLKDFAQLQGTGGVSYAWSHGWTLSCDDCPDPKASPSKKTEYTVIGTDANGCSDTDKVTVEIQLKTTSITGTGGEICDDQSIALTASGAHTYEWSPASGLDDSKSANPIASPHQTTNFMVVAREGSCIPDTHYVKVVVHPKPIVKASGSTKIIAGKSTSIDASGEHIRKFEWKPAESLTCSDCPSPYATPTKTTTYTITGYTEYGCADSANVTITVLCDESQLYIPNTFTPNGDGMNDVFYPRGDGLDKITTFRVYNRWGEIVFERSSFNLNDKQSGWDGTFRGQPLSPDVYVYLVEAKCDNGDLLKIKGDVTLIR